MEPVESEKARSRPTSAASAPAPAGPKLGVHAEGPLSGFGPTSLPVPKTNPPKRILGSYCFLTAEKWKSDFGPGSLLK